MAQRPEGVVTCSYKPRRSEPRRFSAQDAARVTCYAIAAGATREDIDKRIDSTCPDGSKRRPDSAAAEALQAALAVTQGNIDVLNQSYNLFLAVNAVLLALLAIPAIIRRTPVVAIAFRFVAQRQVAVAAQVQVIGRQIAANDALYTQVALALRRAA